MIMPVVIIIIIKTSYIIVSPRRDVFQVDDGPQPRVAVVAETPPQPAHPIHLAVRLDQIESQRAAVRTVLVVEKRYLCVCVCVCKTFGKSKITGKHDCFKQYNKTFLDDIGGGKSGCATYSLTYIGYQSFTTLTRASVCI